MQDFSIGRLQRVIAALPDREQTRLLAVPKRSAHVQQPSVQSLTKQAKQTLDGLKPFAKDNLVDSSELQALETQLQQLRSLTEATTQVVAIKKRA